MDRRIEDGGHDVQEVRGEDRFRPPPSFLLLTPPSNPPESGGKRAHASEMPDHPAAHLSVVSPPVRGGGEGGTAATGPPRE